MSYQKSELYFIFALLAGAGVLTFFIFQPFLYALILAVIFATVFEPIHKRILSATRERAGLAALLTTAFVLMVIVVPIAFLGIQIFKEATQLYSSLLNNGGAAGLSLVIEQMVQRLNIPFLPTESFELSQYLRQGLNWLVQNLDTVFSNATKIMVGIFVLLMALYHLFKDGIKIKKTAISLSPLKDAYDETIFNKLQLSINSVVRGSISIGVIQGVVAATGLALFGVPSPVLWGSVAAMAALIPGFGTSLVLIPAVLFLFFTGAGTAAAGLLVWGLLAVGLVDNVLGPKLMGRGTKLPSFLVLLSILGGVSFFGPIGLLFGPLVLSMLLAFLEIYSAIRKESNL